MGTNGTHRSHARCHPYPIPQPVKRGWPHHWGLRPLLFSSSGVCSFTFHMNWSVPESAVRPDLRFSSSSEKTRKSNQFADVITKAALSSHLFKDPECWSGRGLNPRPSAWRTGALPTELTRRRLINQDWSNIQSKITVTIPWCHRNVRRHYARSTWKAQNEMENR